MRFCDGLLRDEKAVNAAVALPWSNGQVEGQIHRLKLVKRQMYGRAKFNLLRRRVLPYVAAAVTLSPQSPLICTEIAGEPISRERRSSGLAPRSLWRAPVAPVGAWRTGVRARLDCRSRGRPSARLISFSLRSLMAETGTGAGKLDTETPPAIRRDKKNNPRPSVGLVERPMNRMRGIVSFDRRLLALGCFRLRLSGGALYDSQLLQLVCYKGGAVLGEKRAKAHRKRARSQRSYAQGPLPFLFRR